jgi:transposase-like protein
MAVHNKIDYAKLAELHFDPDNPRLGRENTKKDLRESKILELMKDWMLEELALSFLESGFWPQEALIVIKQTVGGKPFLVVVEGNRRLAALKLLKAAFDGKATSKKWEELISHRKAPPRLFEDIPYILADSRKDIVAFLGFRHVTGIKEWNPAEKAEYIAKLVEDDKMSYEEVCRKIGSKSSTVRQHYISYRLLLQMEDQENIDLKAVEKKFSVLYLSLRSEGVQTYLDIDILAEPEKALKPVPQARLKALAKFALWLFGDETHDPVVKESRYVDQFGKALLNADAVSYLERTDKPSLEVAWRIAGGDEGETIEFVQKAADAAEQALSQAHLHKKSAKLQSAIRRLGRDTYQLLALFPKIKDELDKELA